MRKIAVVTGSRSDYGLQRPVMEAILRRSGMKLQVIVTGMHLLPKFGHTIDEIKKDGFRIDAIVPMAARGDTGAAMARGIGKGIIGMVRAFERLKPDLLVVHGDRGEMLAAVIAASHMGITVAHVSGGDVTRGGIDEYVRHAITKMSNIHFAETKKSAERIMRMGERKEYIFDVGSADLDAILNSKLQEKETFEKYGLEKKGFILVVQHPVTTQLRESPRQMHETLEAVAAFRKPVIIIYPNSDAAGRAMINEIETYCKTRRQFQRFRSLPRDEYLCLLKNCLVMVGNSSSGIIEAPAFKIPVVNIGIRQEGRDRSTNVLDASPEMRKIKAAITKCLTDKKIISRVKKCKNIYGDGRTGERIARILSKIRLTPSLIQKKLTY